MSVTGISQGTRHSEARWRASLTRRLCGLSAEEASFRRRGFAVSDPARCHRLEEIGQIFIRGYNLALTKATGPSAEPFAALMAELDSIPPPLRGFAYEGAAMGLGISDALPWTRSDGLRAFLEEVGAPHSYLLHVGAGWAMARLPWRRRRIFQTLDPLLSCLAIDGWGFHDVYFRPARLGKGSTRRDPDHRHVYDQGAGRALWFVSGGDMDRALELISGQHDSRQADLLSGLALAVVYTGICSTEDIQTLTRHAVRDGAAGSAAVAQGAAFALEARALAGNPLPASEWACTALTGRPPDAVLAIVRGQRPARSDIATLEAASGKAAYQSWRHRVQEALSISDKDLSGGRSA